MFVSLLQFFWSESWFVFLPRETLSLSLSLSLSPPPPLWLVPPIESCLACTCTQSAVSLDSLTVRQSQNPWTSCMLSEEDPGVFHPYRRMLLPLLAGPRLGCIDHGFWIISLDVELCSSATDSHAWPYHSLHPPFPLPPSPPLSPAFEARFHMGWHQTSDSASWVLRFTDVCLPCPSLILLITSFCPQCWGLDPGAYVW